MSSELKIFLLGFAAGGLLASGGIYWMLRDGRNSATAPVTSPEPDSRSSHFPPTPIHLSAPASGSPDESSAIAPAALNNPAAEAVTNQAPPDAALSASSRLSYSPWLTAEHNTLLVQQRTVRRPTSLLEMHDRFSTETPDADWAYATENLLTLFLGTEAAREGHELVSVSCRSTICEIQLRSSAPEARNALYRLMDRIYVQEWGRAAFGPWLGIDNRFGAETVTLAAIQRNAVTNDH